MLTAASGVPTCTRVPLVPVFPGACLQGGNRPTVHASEALVLHRSIKLGEEFMLKPASAPVVAPHRLGVITTSTFNLIAGAATTPEVVGTVTRAGITVDPAVAAANASATSSTPLAPRSPPSSSADFRDGDGSAYVGTTTFTPELVVGYCNDFDGKNPIHHDPEVARAAGYRAPIAAGAQGLHICFAHLCTLVGGELPRTLNVASSFKRAIFWDDAVELWYKPVSGVNAGTVNMHTSPPPQHPPG